MNAYATFKVIKTSPAIEAILSVESDNYFSACRVYARRDGDIQAACYAEAERKAAAHGLTLQALRSEG